MKRRHLAPLASLFLAVALTACGTSGGQSAAEPAASETETSAQATEETTSDDAKEEAVPADEATTSDDATAEEKAEEEEGSFKRGTIDGNTYRNESFGISFTLPEDHAFATEDQLAQLANITTDMLEDEASVKALEGGRIIYDMYEYGVDGSNTNIAIEKVNAMAGALIDAKKYREACVSKIDEQLAGTGMEVIDREEATYTIGGTDHPAEKVTITYEGSTIYEEMVFLKSGSFFALVTTAGPTPEAAEALLGYFSEI